MRFPGLPQQSNPKPKMESDMKPQKKIAAFTPLQTDSLSRCRPGTLTTPEMAATKAQTLFGCFRKGDANNPDIYAAAVAAALTCYPPEVVTRVCDPRTGLPARCDFLPTVREIHAACQELVQRTAQANRRDEQVRQQIAEQREIEERRRVAPTRAELEAKLGRPIGERLKTAYGLTDAQWAAIPNRR